MGITCGVGGAALLMGLECGWDGGVEGGVVPYDSAAYSVSQPCFHHL